MSDLVSPHLLAKASQEIDAMVTGLIPEGKRGALIAVFDKHGAQIGLASKVLGDDLRVDISLLQKWRQERPTAQVRVKWSW